MSVTPPTPAPDTPASPPAPTPALIVGPIVAPIAAHGVVGTPSRRPGLGALPYPGGTTFRVWAPNALGVSVRLLSQDLLSQDQPMRQVPLAAEDGGTWSVDVDGVVAGTGYLFAVVAPTNPATNPATANPASANPASANPATANPATANPGSTAGPAVAGAVLERIDPYAKHVTNSAGHALIRDEAAFAWPATGYVSPGWDDLVVYELHLGTFAQLDPGGADSPLAAAARQLPYLRDLGVSAVELLPVAEFAGDQSWGYNPALPFAVESSYGGPAAFQAFVQAAHDVGIAVLLDVVYNHFGPGDLDHDLWRFDGWGQGPYGGVYFYQDARADTPWGATRPDYGRAEVRRYLRDNVACWLQHYRCDGLRFDATAWIRGVDGSGSPAQDLPDGWRLLQEISEDVAGSQPWKILIAEDMRGNEWVTRPSGAGGAGMSSQWDGDFVRQVRDAVVTPDDAARDMSSIADAVRRRFGSSGLNRVVFTESHDADANGRARVPQEIDPADPSSYWAKKRSTLAAAAVLTVPGIPMLFQGQEFLENLWFSDDRPVDWAKRATNAGILRLYTDLIRLRRDRDGTTRGLRGNNVAVHHVNDTDKVVAYHRWDGGGPRDDTVVVLNFGAPGYDAYQLGLPRSGRWRVRLNSDWTGYDPGFGGHRSDDVDAVATPRDGLAWSAALGLGGYTAIVLSQDV